MVTTHTNVNRSHDMYHNHTWIFTYGDHMIIHIQWRNEGFSGIRGWGMVGPVITDRNYNSNLLNYILCLNNLKLVKGRDLFFLTH